MDVKKKEGFKMGMKLKVVAATTMLCIAANAYTNLQQLVNVKVQEDELSPSNVIIRVKVHEVRLGKLIESGDRFDVRCVDGEWKIFAWDDILERGW